MAIPDGPTGVAVTLAYMVQWAREAKVDPDIRTLARQIVAGVPGKNWTLEAQAIQNWVRGNVRYTSDVYDVETLQPPIDTINQGHGDCDDQALLVAALLLAIGHPARFVAVASETPGDFNHVFAETLIGERWYSVETTEPVPIGWQPAQLFSRMVKSI